MRTHYQGWLIFVVFAVCLLAPRGLSFLPFMPALIAFAILSWKQHAPVTIDRSLAFLLGGIVLLGFASALWSDYPADVVKRMVNTGGIFLGGALLFAVTSNVSYGGKTGFAALVGLYILYGFYLAFEYKSLFALTSIMLDKHIDLWNFNRSFVTYCLAFLPVWVLTKRLCGQKRWLYGIRGLMILSAALPLSMTQSQTAQMVAALAVLSYGVIRIAQSQRVRRILFAASGIGICALILASPIIPATLQHLNEGETTQSSLAAQANMAGRIEIWNFVAGHIHEKPWFGHGIEATKHFISPVVLPVNDTTGVLHPHNSYLQIWVELGLAGAIIACLIVLLALRRIAQSDPAHQPLYFGVFGGVTIMLATGYGLWQSWHLGLIFAAAALCLIVTRVHPPSKTVI